MENTDFNEDNSDFYDAGYFASLEERYSKGSHRSRTNNILSVLKKAGRISGKKILDVGCGSGYFADQFRHLGANVTAIDYSDAAIDFASNKYAGINFLRQSLYELDGFSDGEFDIVVMIDAIEHLSDQHAALAQIKRVLRPGGSLLVATDVSNGKWQGKLAAKFINFSNLFSRDGRAFRRIRREESQRRKTRNYHASHVNELSFLEIKKILTSSGFKIVEHRIYPIVGVPLRDIFLRILPFDFRGDHQCILATRED